MPETPLLSVAIPSYNHQDYIGTAIRSVFVQDYQPIELVIVDDGSSDKSREVIKALLEDSPLARARLIEQENQGAHAAIARAIESSEGEVIAILNSDDFYLPGRLRILAGALAERNGGVAFSALGCVDSQGQPRPADDAWSLWYETGLVARHSCPTTSFALLLNNFSVTSSNFVFARTLYDTLGGFSSHKFCHDWDFLMRSALHAEPVFVEHDLLRYRVHETNSTIGLRDVQVEEVSDALNRFFRAGLAQAPRNPIAPLPQNWPYLFPDFVLSRPFHFGDGSIADHIDPLLRLELFETAFHRRAA